MSFRVDPIAFFTGDERRNAINSLRLYFAEYTGRYFERFANSRTPHFTPQDIVAVTMLGVDVPARAATWLLLEGVAATGQLLCEIPEDAAIWDPVDLGPSGAAWRLHDLLMEHRGLGRTITSKLLAAKRPHLLPIYDKHVGTALLFDEHDNYWDGWRESLSGAPGVLVRDACRDVVEEAGVGSHLSVLRILDVAIWMRVHGDPRIAQVNRFWE